MRVPLRQLVFWLHLVAAVAAGLVILLMSVTGVLLAYEVQIMELADRELRRLPPVSAVGGGVSESPLSPAALLETVRTSQPELAATALILPSDPNHAATLVLGREGAFFLDPRDGAVLGASSPGLRKFFTTVTTLHRTIGASGERRELGKAITGVANLVFVFVLISGAYLWLPRLWSKANLRNALWFRRSASPKARDFNWHHVFGVWSVLPLLAIVVSALPISYGWAGDVVMWMTGSSEGRPIGERSAAAGPTASAAAPRPAVAAGSVGATGGGRAKTPSLADLDLTLLDGIVDRAAAEVPGWRTLSVRLQPATDGSLAVTADRNKRRGRPDLRVQLAFDRATGELIRHEPFASQSLGRRVRGWMRWIHTGEAAGLGGQTVAMVVSAAAVMLVWTGIALTWRRLRGWLARRGQARRVPRTAGVESLPDRPSEIAEIAEIAAASRPTTT